MKLTNPLTLASFILMVLFFAGCSSTNLQDDKALNVLNNSDQPFTVNAIERETANLVDVLPKFMIDDDNRIIQPQESTSISIGEINGDYRFGDDIRFFVYSVQGDSAFYNNSVDITSKDLLSSGFQVAFNFRDNQFFAED